jgi:mannose-6-phosphate isomerase-like protein (cupin superfamily)
MHRWKWNFFLVVSGELFIDVEKNDYQLIDETRLGPGDAVTVKPGEYHQFRTGKKPCLAYEIYYCEPLSQDIIRRNVGSIQNKRPKKR